MHHLVGNGGDAFAGKRLLAGGHPVEHHPKGEKVRAAVHRCAGNLLRRHEGGRAQDLPGHRGLSRGELGHAEVGDFRALDAVDLLGGEQDIGGLDVAVNDAALVRVAQGLGNPLADLADAIKAHALAAFQRVGESLSADELHHQKGHALVLAHIEDGNNAGMRQGAGGARFTVKALAKIASPFAGKHQRDDGL